MLVWKMIFHPWLIFRGVVNPNPEDIGQCDDGLPEREGNETEGVVEELLLIDGTLAAAMASGYSINKSKAG